MATTSKDLVAKMIKALFGLASHQLKIAKRWFTQTSINLNQATLLCVTLTDTDTDQRTEEGMLRLMLSSSTVATGDFP